MEDLHSSDDGWMPSHEPDEDPVVDMGLVNSIFLRGFCGFVGELSIEPRPGMNLFVGPNNCGKSSLLCLVHFLPQLPGPSSTKTVLSGAVSSPLLPKELKDLINMFGSEAEVGLGAYRWKLFLENGNVVAELIQPGFALVPLVAHIRGLASRKRDAMEDESWTEMCRQLEGEKAELMNGLQVVLDLEGTFCGLRVRGGDLWASLKSNSDHELVRLSSHSGMGLKQALVIAFEILSTEARVLVLDEPLAELHWGFLSHFMVWMRKQDRQYFIATHSAQIMDCCWGEGIFLLPEGNAIGRLADLPHTLVQIAGAQNVFCVEGNDEKFLRAWSSISDALPKGIVFLHDNLWHNHILRLSQAFSSFSNAVAKKFFVLHDNDYYESDPDDWKMHREKHSIFHCRLSVRHVECLGMDAGVVKAILGENGISFEEYWKYWIETDDGRKACTFEKAEKAFRSRYPKEDREKERAVWVANAWDWIYWKKHRYSFWRGLRDFDSVKGAKLPSFSDARTFAAFAEERKIVPTCVLLLVEQLLKCFRIEPASRKGSI